MLSDTRHSTLFPLLAHLNLLSYGLTLDFDSVGIQSTSDLCNKLDALPTSASSMLQKSLGRSPILNVAQENATIAPRLSSSSGTNASSSMHQLMKLEAPHHHPQIPIINEMKLEVKENDARRRSDTMEQKTFSKRIASSRTTATSSIFVGVSLLALGVPCSRKIDNIKQGERSMLLDNAKVLAQFLVIYMHILSSDTAGYWNDASSGFDGGRGEGGFATTLFDGFSAISIPLLCFISGMLSQGPTTRRKLQRFVCYLLVPVLLWVHFAKPVLLDSMIDLDPAALAVRFQSVWRLQSFHEEWYFQALVLWRGSVLLLWSNFNAHVSLLSMFGLSAVAGYLDFSGSLWKLDAVFGFLPYFAVGYVFPFHAAYHATERRHVPVMVVVVFVLLWVFAFIPLVGALPYGHGNYSCCTAGTVFRSIDALDYSLYWMRRLARVTLELVPTLLLLFYAIPRTETILSWVGPRILYPYLFQEVANHWRLRVIHAHAQWLASNNVAVLLLHAPYVILVLVVFASQPWRMLFSWCLEPKWLSFFLEEELSHLTDSANSVDYASKLCAESMEHEHLDKHNSAPAELTSEALEKAGLAESIEERKPVPEEDAVSIESIPELQPPRDWHPSARWRSTGPDIPWQSHARPYYPLLAPIFIILVLSVNGPAIWAVLRAIPYLNVMCESIPISLAVVVLIVTLTIDVIFYIFHYFRLQGTDREPESSNANPLTHAVIVCAYKEPMDVLIRTFDSISKQRGICKRLVVVFAGEARDDTAQGAFEELARRFGHKFHRFMLTSHTLSEGEAIGKSSNENFAGQELYRRLVEEEGHNPFEVLVTVVDADSVLSPTYLAHVESCYRCQRDGRRLIYNGPLNTYRNFDDAGFMVQSHEMRRCHDDTFMSPFLQHVPLSNYSLSLGFLQEIDFWTPDVMPEDIHTANRAMLNSFGSRQTIPVPSIICNDLVVNFDDRYTQAKRHHYGSVSEFAWTISLFRSKFNFYAWLHICQAEVLRPGSFVHIVIDTSTRFARMLFCYQVMVYWSTFTSKTRMYIGFYACAFVWQYFCLAIAEGLLWTTLLQQFPIKKPSLGRWFLLVISMPLVSQINHIVFTFVPILDCLWQITFKGELVYVCAPKGDGVPAVDQSSRGNDTKSKTLIEGQ